MFVLKVKRGDEVHLESNEPFRGRLLVGEKNGHRQLSFDLPRAVKVRLNPSNATRATNEEES